MHEMRTDPKNFEYLCVSGCRRDIRTWDMEENGQVAFTDSADRARLDTDPMYKLEKGKEQGLARFISEMIFITFYQYHKISVSSIYHWYDEK